MGNHCIACGSRNVSVVRERVDMWIVFRYRCEDCGKLWATDRLATDAEKEQDNG